MAASDIDTLWVGAPFKPVFDPALHPALTLLFAAVGLVYAGKFTVTRGDLTKEAMFAAISSAALGLATVIGAQAFGLYL
ncbi:hypothetical protein LPJ63_004564 [Coemansia sp. RSA 2711]|nr:hypothetical protein LPJ70_007051 [Coemansia sp. RSA 2708]KAJ1831019.1 hypothetical protein LPJ63_004564 [Coemansia sp. RSA 2711]KAJ2356265.1 hypothetical protein H4S01_006734 [Coemansia sp. RSA 2610]KAJ2356980.1 hypothetical protein H4S02_012634 [Coemansia sp. RSA 2611]